MDISVEHNNENAKQVIVSTLIESRPALFEAEVMKKAKTILEDVTLLARCATTRCLITYSDAIAFRGHGNAQNGRWLDEVYANAIEPLVFPDLTMLVVNKATKRPSQGAFDERRTILSGIREEDVPNEQLRCFWFEEYEDVLGQLEPVPKELQFGRYLTPQPAKEREIARAVANAMDRAARAGVELLKVGKDYPSSLSRADLSALASHLWDKQNGRCALTGKKFELLSDEEGGLQDDRVSLDRIDNSIGYADGNVQLVTQFANRARGTLSIEEARNRLVQFHNL